MNDYIPLIIGVLRSVHLKYLKLLEQVLKLWVQIWVHFFKFVMFNVQSNGNNQFLL